MPKLYHFVLMRGGCFEIVKPKIYNPEVGHLGFSSEIVMFHLLVQNRCPLLELPCGLYRVLRQTHTHTHEGTHVQCSSCSNWQNMKLELSV